MQHRVGGGPCLQHRVGGGPCLLQLPPLWLFPLLTQLLLLSKKLPSEKKRSKRHCKSKRREPQVLTKTCVLLVRKLPSGRVFPHYNDFSHQLTGLYRAYSFLSLYSFHRSLRCIACSINDSRKARACCCQSHARGSAIKFE